MKLIVILVLFPLNITATFSQTTKPAYDSTLAKALGGDDYGMKMYVFVILKTGSFSTDDKALRDSLFTGHMENIGRLADAGKLVVAGPMGKNDKSYRGIFIFNAKTVEEVQPYLDADPAIKQKLLEPELYLWYGSAALPTYLENHRKIEKNKP